MVSSAASPQSNLSEASLEELLNTTVTSVGKKHQELSKAAAAVFVIGQEDIRRSGATSIPELLRLAPGVDVARINAGNWAVSIRGFNGIYSNKVLVLVDGRSVYTSTFSGVFWDQLDLPVEEIDRIEVIRGPGASVWGANAVNGVINIITRPAEDAGGSLTVQAGTAQQLASSTVSYGAALGAHGHYRAFAGGTDVGNSFVPGGWGGADHLRALHTGFRSDWRFGSQDSLTVEGEFLDDHGSYTRQDSLIPSPVTTEFLQPFESHGGSFLTRWTRTASGSEQSLQVYYGTYRRVQLGLPIGERALDFDYQNHRRIAARHDLVWGLGLRMTTTHLDSADWIQFTPRNRSENLYSASLQDEIALGPKVLLTVGSRFEHNRYTGFESEPGVRVAWTPTALTTVWASASRAIRQPNSEEASVTVDVGWHAIDQQTLGLLRDYGNPNLRSETVRDYEVGYRRQVGKTVSVDLAAFLSFYRDLIALSTLPPVLNTTGRAPYLELPQVMRNDGHATNFGGEIAANWNAASRWRLRSSYSLLRTSAHVNGGSPSSLEFNILDSPEHMVQIRSLLDLGRHWTFDQTFWWTSVVGLGIPSHSRLDLRLARTLGESAEISIAGVNLLTPGTLEFDDTYGVVATQLRRSVSAQVSWRF